MKKLYCWKDGIYISKSIINDRFYITNLTFEHIDNYNNRNHNHEEYKSIETIPCCDLLKVASLNEKWGVIDLHGNIIIPLQFKEIQVFSPTLFFVIEEKTIDCYEEKDIEKFRNVVHKEQISDSWCLEKTRVTCEYIGVYNDRGEELHPPTIETIELLKGNSYFKILEGGLYGIIDLDGKCIIPQIYTRLEQITFKGEMLFEGNRSDKKELIKINGETLPLELFGHHNYKLKVDNKYLLYNGQKSLDIITLYDDIQCLSDEDEIDDYYCPPTYGYFKIKNDNHWGIIKEGKEILSPIYNEIINENRISSLIDDYNCLIQYSVISDGNKKVGCINNYGYIVFTEKYDDIKLVDRENYAIQKNGLWGIIDLCSNYILLPEYDDIIVDEKLYLSTNVIIRKGNKYGVFNLTRGLIIPVIYDIIKYDLYLFYAKQGSFFYKFDNNGILVSKYNLLTDYSQGYEDEKSEIFIRDSSDIDLSTDEQFYRINN